MEQNLNIKATYLTDHGIMSEKEFADYCAVKNPQMPTLRDQIAIAALSALLFREQNTFKSAKDLAKDWQLSP